MNIIKRIVKHIRWRVGFIFKISIKQKYYSWFLPKTVMSGPFMGMHYVTQSMGSVILPKLTGTYEDELHGLLLEIKKNPYSKFIDVGAAEGYYAVGFKKYLFPHLKNTIAFETTKKGRNLIKKLAIKNEVSIDIRGHCDIKALGDVLTDEKTMIIVDIEGGEYELLNPDKLNFMFCDVLVEIHHASVAHKKNQIIEKFDKTHNISEIKIGQKKLPQSILVKPIIHKNAKYILNEFRGDESWIFMQSKEKL